MKGITSFAASEGLASAPYPAIEGGNRTKTPRPEGAGEKFPTHPLEDSKAYVADSMALLFASYLVFWAVRTLITVSSLIAPGGADVLTR